MDYSRIIRDLQLEKEKLYRAIEQLEALDCTGTEPASHRRGRKSMDAEERKEV